MPVPSTMVFRLEKGSPLTALAGDNNFKALRDFSNAQEARVNSALNPDGSVKTPLVLYGASASATDEYVISVAYTATSYAYFLGKVVLLKADVSNAGPTTPATLKINPLTTAIAIKKYKDQDLANGDIKAGQIAILTYDGTYFQLHNPSTSAPANYYADDGAANAYRISNPTGTFSVPYAYYTGYEVKFKALNANTGASTLQVISPGGSLPATSLRFRGLELTGGEITAGLMVTAIYDGSVFQITTVPVKQAWDFTSSEIAVPTTETTVMAAHGLGVVPSRWRAVLKCTDAGGDLGWVQNSEVELDHAVNNANPDFSAVSIGVDGTSIVAACFGGDGQWQIGRYDTGARAMMTKSKWRIKFYVSR
jgi:hypothetical protein